MMTMIEKLVSILQTKGELKSVANEFGAGISDEPFSEYPERFRGLSAKSGYCRCVSSDSRDSSWSGNRFVSVRGGYSLSDEMRNGMRYDGFVPEEGKVYNLDTMAEVDSFYDANAGRNVSSFSVSAPGIYSHLSGTYRRDGSNNDGYPRYVSGDGKVFEVLRVSGETIRRERIHLKLVSGANAPITDNLRLFPNFMLNPGIDGYLNEGFGHIYYPDYKLASPYVISYDDSLQSYVISCHENTWINWYRPVFVDGHKPVVDKKSVPFDVSVLNQYVYWELVGGGDGKIVMEFSRESVPDQKDDRVCPRYVISDSQGFLISSSIAGMEGMVSSDPFSRDMLTGNNDFPQVGRLSYSFP